MSEHELNKLVVESAELVLHMVNIVSAIAVGIIEDKNIEDVVPMFKHSYDILRNYFKNRKDVIKVVCGEHD